MKVDMSAEAVTIRLKRVSQLRRLCLELGKMQPVPSNKTIESHNRAADPQPSLDAPASRDLATTHRS